MQFKTFDIVPHGTKFDFVGKRKIALILSTHRQPVGHPLVAPAGPRPRLRRGLRGRHRDAGEVRQDRRPRRHPQEHRGARASRTPRSRPTAPRASTATSSASGASRCSRPRTSARIVAAVKAKFPVIGAPAFNPEMGDKIDFEFQVPPWPRPSCRRSSRRPGSRSARSARRPGSPPAPARWPSSPRASRTRSRRSWPPVRRRQARGAARRVRRPGGGARAPQPGVQGHPLRHGAHRGLRRPALRLPLLARASSSPSSTTPSSRSATSPSAAASST